MIQKLVLSGMTGAVIISSILVYNDFNPFKNQHWLMTAAAIAATGTLVAELMSRKKTQNVLKKSLKAYLKSLPASAPQWQPAIELLEAIQTAESQENRQL